MIPLPLGELESLGRLEAAPWAVEVTGVRVDSRLVEEGDLFVAVGTGADYVKHAFARGAAAALVPDDAHRALAALGRAVRERSAAKVVGVTGSIGKTSTKDLLAAMCAATARTVAAEHGFNQEIGVPLTVCRIEPVTATTFAALRSLTARPSEASARCASSGTSAAAAPRANACLT